MFGSRVELLDRTAASPEETLRTGLALFRETRVAAVIGGTDDRAAEALTQAARDASGLFLNVGAAADRLRRELCDRRTFHVHASTEMLVSAAGLWLLEQRKAARWAVVCSDSPSGAEVETAAARFLEGRAAKIVARERVAVKTTDWAPRLGKLRDAKPDAVVLGLAAADLPAFLAGYREAALSAELAPVAADPSAALNADPSTLAGTWPLQWHHSLERYSARELNGRYRRRFDGPLDGAAWAAWAAVKILVESAVRAQTTDTQGILEFLESRLAFDGHKGTVLDFRKADHQLGQPLYLARRRAAKAGDEPGTLEVTEVSRERLDAAAGTSGPCGRQG